MLNNMLDGRERATPVSTCCTMCQAAAHCVKTGGVGDWLGVTGARSYFTCSEPSYDDNQSRKSGVK